MIQQVSVRILFCGLVKKRKLLLKSAIAKRRYRRKTD